MVTYLFQDTILCLLVLMLLKVEMSFQEKTMHQVSVLLPHIAVNEQFDLGQIQTI